MTDTVITQPEQASRGVVSEGGCTGSALWSSQASMNRVPHDRLVIERGEGAFVWDQHGRRLLDVGSGLWHCNIGHGRHELADAAHAQMTQLETYHTFGRVANRRAIELADRLAALAPIADAKVYFTSGGSDAVDAAAKLIRRFWVETGKPDKRVIITREGAYHGLHAYGTSLAGIEENRHGYGTPSLVPDTARVAANDVHSLQDLLHDRGGEVAAVLLEAVLGTGGFLPPAPGYLDGVQALCRAHDVLLVLDEVITGFGRTGALFASQRFDLEPDILLVAKGITSGYAPLGAVVVGPRVAAPFWQGSDPAVFRHGLTYSGHATACAVAHANLDILERDELADRVASLAPTLAESLQSLADHRLVEEIRGPVGFMAGVKLTDTTIAENAARRALERGLLVRPVSGGTLGVCPPFVTDLEDLLMMGPRLREVLDDLEM
ncbi:MAG TPA: aminotransferase class III-fold pyridoxal phosphate-dependent enzyme [Chloroflexota bacterium]